MTTDECKTLLTHWASTIPVGDPLERFRPDQGLGNWKRGKKFSRQATVIREFYRVGAPGHKVHVLECPGNVTRIVEDLPAELLSKASDWCFSIDEDSQESDETYFFLVERSFWRKHHCVSDQDIDEPRHLLPPGYGCAMESMYSLKGGREEVRQELLSRGFLELTDTDFDA